METNKILYLLVLLHLFLGCSNYKKENEIINNSYKGLGVFFYNEIDGGSVYEIKFIPFHLKNENVIENISLPKIFSKQNEIIFEKGISFNSFRDRDVFDSIFTNSKSCGDIKYCFVYIDFIENEQNVIDKWYKKRGYSSEVCIGDEKYKVTYDPTEIMAKYLIKIKTLNIIN